LTHEYVAIKLPCNIVNEVLDPLVGTHGYSSRADVLKDALRRLSEKYKPVREQLQSFIENKGELLACGTCMKNRQKEESNFCPIATLKDMLDIVMWSDKLVTFG
jgi:Arc/MetJ-type ribon-helix-helix transcriptional regulator